MWCGVGKRKAHPGNHKGLVWLGSGQMQEAMTPQLERWPGKGSECRLWNWRLKLREAPKFVTSGATWSELKWI